jgi:hypothetical protein
LHDIAFNGERTIRKILNKYKLILDEKSKSDPFFQLSGHLLHIDPHSFAGFSVTLSNPKCSLVSLVP